jgi:Protein of unknown function (DUF2889)
MSNLNKSSANSNPDYGSGIYRRRIRLENRPQQVVAELEDTTHAFRLTLAHDDGCVTDIVAEPIRYPFDSCPGAVALLQPLIGCSLDTDSSSLRRLLEPGHNCTHLYDLALLALAHSARPSRLRIYDICVPDELENGTAIKLVCDGITVHEWQVRSHQVVAPATLAGNPLKQGFYRWASDEFSGESLESALVLQRGYFVAQSRRYDYMRSGGRPAQDDNMPEGACYTYNAGVVEQAIHTDGMARDFTDTAEKLLQFV